MRSFRMQVLRGQKLLRNIRQIGHEQSNTGHDDRYQRCGRIFVHPSDDDIQHREFTHYKQPQQCLICLFSLPELYVQNKTSYAQPRYAVKQTPVSFSPRFLTRCLHQKCAIQHNSSEIDRLFEHFPNVLFALFPVVVFFFNIILSSCFFYSGPTKKSKIFTALLCHRFLLSVYFLHHSMLLSPKVSLTLLS